MSSPQLEYITRCRVPGCTKQFVSSPLEIPIIGQPNERVVKHVTALLEHITKKHPQAMQQVAGAVQEYMGYLIVSMFQCQDPNLLQLHERVRAALHRFSTRTILSDDEINAKVAQLELEPEQEEGISALLCDMRDLLQEQGRYAPDLQPAAPSPLITP